MATAVLETGARPASKRVEGTRNQRTAYDAVIVLGSKIRRSQFRLNRPDLYRGADTYVTNDYRHHDVFGMLGAGVRLVVAEDLVVRGATNVVIFTGGRSQKTIAEIGDDAPPESHVYRNRFERILSRRRELAQRRGLPRIPHATVEAEDKSVNTAANLAAVLAMMDERHWQNVAIITNNYHTTRVAFLLNRELDGADGKQVGIIGAESYLLTVFPGKYDAVIRRAARSVQAAKRRWHERVGLNDSRNKRYHQGEYQLTK